eukprot:Hpha_TRINITY_DN16223_c1_g3::TRINITY_DN16223_c1_g3_i2::g.13247::m.13247
MWQFVILLLFIPPEVGAKVVLHVVSPIQGPDDPCADDCRCNASSSLRYNLTCEFMRLNPDIEVRFRKAGWGTLFTEVENAAFSTNESLRADIVYVGSTWMLDLVKRGVVRNLQPYLNDLRLMRARGDLTLEFARQCEMDFKIDGDYWAIPEALGSRTLFYRQDLYKRYLNTTTPPATLQEMWENGLTIQEGEQKEGRTVWGYVTELEHNILQHFVPFYLGFGGSLLDRAGNCGFRTNEFKGAVEMLNDMYNSPARKVMPNEITGMHRAQEIFRQGNAAHMITGGWLWWELGQLNFGNSSEPSVNVAMTPAGPKGRFAFLGADAWAITGTSSHPDEAWKYLQYLTDPDGAHYEIVQSEGGISPYNRLWRYASDMPHMQTQIDQLPYSFSQYFPTSGNLWMPRLETNETVGKMVRRVLSGEMGITQSAEVACAEMDQLFCCDPVDKAIVHTEFPAYGIVLVVGVVVIALVVCVMWFRKWRQANYLYSNTKVTEHCAESIAAMQLEEVEYIRSIKNPNRIQRAFIQIIDALHEYRRYLPPSVRISFNDDFIDQGDHLSPFEDRRAFMAPPMDAGPLLRLSAQGCGGVSPNTEGSSKDHLVSASTSPRYAQSGQSSPRASVRHSSGGMSKSDCGASSEAPVSVFDLPQHKDPTADYLKVPSTSNLLTKLQAGQERRQVAVSVINLIGTLRIDIDSKRYREELVSNCVQHTMSSKGVLEGMTGDRARCSWNASRPCVRCRVHSLVATMKITGAAHSDGPIQMSAGVTSGEALCGAESAMDFRYYLIDGPKIAFAFVLERIAAREAVKLRDALMCPHSVTLCDMNVKQDTTLEVSHRWCGLFSFNKLGTKASSIWHVIELYEREGHGQEWMYELAERQEVWAMYSNAAHRLSEDTLRLLSACIDDLPEPALAKYYTEQLMAHLMNKTTPGVVSVNDVGLQQSPIEILPASAAGS